MHKDLQKVSALTTLSRDEFSVVVFGFKEFFWHVAGFSTKIIGKRPFEGNVMQFGCRINVTVILKAHYVQLFKLK